MSEVLSVINDVVTTAEDDWIGVFQQRGVWHLTRDIVERWVARNTAFFDMLIRLVPRGSNILELGCGPGRHGLGAVTLGFQVVGIDVDPQIVMQAQTNARLIAPEGKIEFKIGDMFKLGVVAPDRKFQAITHGGVMEHLDSAKSIRQALKVQLEYAPTIIFDVPFDSPKNRLLFERDDIFRQLWTPDEWVHDVLAGLPIFEIATDLHQEDNMTDDLVIALRA